MIASALYRRPELLDAQQHRHRRLTELTDWSIAREIHAMYLTATEFTQAALDYPIVFVQTGEVGGLVHFKKVEPLQTLYSSVYFVD